MRKLLYLSVIAGVMLSASAFADFYDDGVVAYTVQDYPGAIAAFKKDLKANPNHTDAMYHLGMAYFKNKQYEEARQSFEMVRRVTAPYEDMNKESKRYLDKIDTRLMANAGLQGTPQKRSSSMMANFSNEALADGSNYYGYINEQGLANTFDLNRPIKIFVESGRGVPGWTPEKEKAALQSAFVAWRGALNNRVQFQMAASAEASDIVVRWNKTDPEAAGVCQPYGWGGKQLQAYVDMYTMHPDGTPYSGADLNSTAIHEFGHALGIQGHSPFEEDIMYYTFSHRQSGRPTGRDIKTMQMIYSERAYLQD